MTSNIDKELKNLFKISKYAGERFDLIQAAGGNASVKIDNQIFIKSSGFAMSQIENGFSRVDTHIVKSILNERIQDKKIIQDRMQSAMPKGEKKPSIEIFLHAVLKKYTLHTHPIAANNILCDKEWKSILKQIFPNLDYICIEYKTPGILLGIDLYDKIVSRKNTSNVFFLQNHGLIVHSDYHEEVIEKTDFINIEIEKFLSLDYEKYRLTNKISKLIHHFDDNLVSYLNEDVVIDNIFKNKPDLFYQKPTCPDTVVFNGSRVCFIENFDDLNGINKFIENTKTLPKIIICQEKIFFINSSIAKAKESQEVFKFHLLVLNGVNKALYLKDDEINFLANWEEEKYRQKLQAI